ncbi:hypothetical protein QK289_03875, partial [Exiguobacterium antarcticum]
NCIRGLLGRSVALNLTNRRIKKPFPKCNQFKPSLQIEIDYQSFSVILIMCLITSLCEALIFERMSIKNKSNDIL